MNAEVLGVAAIVSAIVKLVVDHVVEPVKEKVEEWIRYGYLVVGAGLGWLTELNAFPDLFPERPLVGRALTALLIGGGPELIRQVVEGINSVRLTYYEQMRTLEYQLAKDWRTQNAQALAAAPQDAGTVLGELMSVLMRVLDPDRYEVVRQALVEYEESGADEDPDN